MLPDRVSNPGPLTYESGTLPIALRGPAQNSLILLDIVICKGNYFQRKRKRGRSLFYIVCRKTDSQTSHTVRKIWGC